MISRITHYDSSQVSQTFIILCNKINEIVDFLSDRFPEEEETIENKFAAHNQYHEVGCPCLKMSPEELDKRLDELEVDLLSGKDTIAYVGAGHEEYLANKKAKVELMDRAIEEIEEQISLNKGKSKDMDIGLRIGYVNSIKILEDIKHEAEK